MVKWLRVQIAFEEDLSTVPSPHVEWLITIFKYCSRKFYSNIVHLISDAQTPRGHGTHQYNYKKIRNKTLNQLYI